MKAAEPPPAAARRPARPARWAAAYLTLQGLAALGWWLLLLGQPATRARFLVTGAPEATLLAFAAADLVLFIGGSLAVAAGLWAGKGWAWPLLLVHAGAAMYAALYAIGLWALDRSAWLPALLMAPALVVPPLLAWWLRPRRLPPCS
jgi:hypothetical protein